MAKRPTSEKLESRGSIEKNGSNNQRIPLVREIVERINLRYLHAIENNRNYIPSNISRAKNIFHVAEMIFLSRIFPPCVIFLSGVRASPRVSTPIKFHRKV